MRVQRKRQILDNAFPQSPEANAGYDSAVYAWHNIQAQARDEYKARVEAVEAQLIVLKAKLYDYLTA